MAQAWHENGTLAIEKRQRSAEFRSGAFLLESQQPLCWKPALRNGTRMRLSFF
jgi:hypothetical protein